MSDRIAARLVRISYETEQIRSLEFVAADGSVLPKFSPGSHIALDLPQLGERQYSLLPSPSGAERYVIAVLREERGRGGSRFIHDQLRVGQVLPIGTPRNLFPLAEDAASSFLFAGGIGVTPLLAMAQRLAELGRPFAFHYACKTRAAAAFVREIETWIGPHLHFDDEAGTLFDFGTALAAAPPDAHLYCCGPAPMIDAFVASAEARGFPATQIHREYFTAREAPATEGGFTVELARSRRTIRVEPGQTILAALRTAGVRVVTSCEQGICGACEARVLSGIPDHRDSVLSAAEQAENRAIMLCCSGARTPVLVLDL